MIYLKKIGRSAGPISQTDFCYIHQWVRCSNVTENYNPVHAITIGVVCYGDEAGAVKTPDDM